MTPSSSSFCTWHSFHGFWCLPIIIVGEFLHRNRIGFCTSQCSKMYSSVAKLNKMLLDSAVMTSTPAPFSFVRNDGHESALLAIKGGHHKQTHIAHTSCNAGLNMMDAPQLQLACNGMVKYLTQQKSMNFRRWLINWSKKYTKTLNFETTNNLTRSG